MTIHQWLQFCKCESGFWEILHAPLTLLATFAFRYRRAHTQILMSSGKRTHLIDNSRPRDIISRSRKRTGPGWSGYVPTRWSAVGWRGKLSKLLLIEWLARDIDTVHGIYGEPSSCFASDSNDVPPMPHVQPCYSATRRSFSPRYKCRSLRENKCVEIDLGKINGVGRFG